MAQEQRAKGLLHPPSRYHLCCSIFSQRRPHSVLRTLPRHNGRTRPPLHKQGALPRPSRRQLREVISHTPDLRPSIPRALSVRNRRSYCIPSSHFLSIAILANFQPFVNGGCNRAHLRSISAALGDRRLGNFRAADEPGQLQLPRPLSVQRLDGRIRPARRARTWRPADGSPPSPRSGADASRTEPACSSRQLASFSATRWAARPETPASTSSKIRVGTASRSAMHILDGQHDPRQLAAGGDAGSWALMPRPRWRTSKTAPHPSPSALGLCLCQTGRQTAPGAYPAGDSSSTMRSDNRAPAVRRVARMRLGGAPAAAPSGLPGAWASCLQAVVREFDLVQLAACALFAQGQHAPPRRPRICGKAAAAGQCGSPACSSSVCAVGKVAAAGSRSILRQRPAPRT